MEYKVGDQVLASYEGFGHRLKNVPAIILKKTGANSYHMMIDGQLWSLPSSALKPADTKQIFCINNPRLNKEKQCES